MKLPLLYCLCSGVASLTAVLSSCQEHCNTTFTYRSVTPVYMSVENLREEKTVVLTPRTLKYPGKIYVYGDYLFINEYNEGIHVVDNSDPATPEVMNFISVPGNVDMAVNDHILYADNYVDLLAFDIRDPENISLEKRVEDVFQSLYVDTENRIFMAMKDTLITQAVEGGCGGSRGILKPERGEVFLNMQGTDAYSVAGGGNYGTGGSMARFTLMNNYLYTVTDHDLRLFDVSEPSSPAYISNIDIGWGVETIFPYQDRLFIGTNTGMHIFDASDPAVPVHLAAYQHVNSCDPVVVKGKYAYVTLRSGNACNGFTNQLEVVDLSDIRAPSLLKAYPMQNPHGLGVSSNYLFICEGEYGLKSFDISDVKKIDQRQMEHLKDIQAIDVIPAGESLIVTGPGGIYQFDYSNPGKLRQLSKILVSNNY